MRKRDGAGRQRVERQSFGVCRVCQANRIVPCAGLPVRQTGGICFGSCFRSHAQRDARQALALALALACWHAVKQRPVGAADTTQTP